MTLPALAKLHRSLLALLLAIAATTAVAQEDAHQAAPQEQRQGAPQERRGQPQATADQGDFVAGHVTVRLPDDPGRFLMKPATIGLEEMTPENIISVDLDGRKVDGMMPRHNEVFIHSEVLRVRSDIAAVVHTHAPHAVAFSSLGRELVPVNNEAGYFYKRLPVFA